MDWPTEMQLAKQPIPALRELALVTLPSAVLFVS